MRGSSAAFALLMACGVGVWGACSSPSESGSNPGAGSTGGTTPVSGSGAGGGGPSGDACKSVTGCAGEVVGSWSVASSCLKLSGELDLRPYGSCEHAPISGSLSVAGKIAFNANGTFTD